MNHTIQIHWEQVQQIIQDELCWDLEQLERDLENRKRGDGMAIFDHDTDKDCLEIERHINAVKLILKYYGV